MLYPAISMAVLLGLVVVVGLVARRGDGDSNVRADAAERRFARNLRRSPCCRREVSFAAGGSLRCAECNRGFMPSEVRYE